MRQATPDAYRLRRFRVVLVAVLAAPWLASAVLVLLGWHYSNRWVGLQLLLDLALTAFALRSPGGFATWWILLRLLGGAIGAVLIGQSVYAFAFGAFDALAAVLLIVLVMPASRPARRERARRRLERQQIRRGEVQSAYEVQPSMNRQARIERDGYL
jgi:hypothetical protein